MADFEDANSPTWEQLHRGPAQPHRRARPHDRARHRREAVPAERRGRRPLRPAARLAPRRAPLRGRRRADVRLAVRLRPLLPPQPRPQRPLLLPAEARVAPRGAPLERRLLLRAGPARRAARDDQGDRPDRDDPRRVRDGRDPLRAARALGRAQRRALGLHLQRDQEARPPARVRAARPRRRDDGGAVHALLLRAAREDLPPPRRVRDGRHGGVHPLAARPRGERVALAKVREDKEREASQGFDGTWVAHPDLVPVAMEAFDARARRPAEPDRPAARRRAGDRGRPARRRRDAGRRHRGKGCATTSRSASSTSPPGCRATAPSRSTT